MLKHHEVAFTQFIDTAVRCGASTTPWDSVYTWFNAKRINKTVWRAIFSKYAELCEYYDYPESLGLRAISAEGFITLIRDPKQSEQHYRIDEGGATALDHSIDLSVLDDED